MIYVNYSLTQGKNALFPALFSPFDQVAISAVMIFYLAALGVSVAIILRNLWKKKT